MKYLASVLQVAAICALFSASAHAVPVAWSVDGLIRADGGTVSGSFTYDADTGTYSAVNVITTQGTSTLLPGETYAGFDPASSDATGLILQRTQGAPDVSGQNNIFLSFPALTNAGGTLSVAGVSSEVLCTNSDCTSATNTEALSGDIVGTVATTPPTSSTAIPMMPVWLIAMMALAMAALAASKLQRSAKRRS